MFETIGNDNDNKIATLYVLRKNSHLFNWHFRWIDPSSEQHQSRPAEFRLEKRPHGWLRVQGTFLLDLPVAFSAEEEAARYL